MGYTCSIVSIKCSKIAYIKLIESTFNKDLSATETCSLFELEIPSCTASHKVKGSSMFG